VPRHSRPWPTRPAERKGRVLGGAPGLRRSAFGKQGLREEQLHLGLVCPVDDVARPQRGQGPFGSRAGIGGQAGMEQHLGPVSLQHRDLPRGVADGSVRGAGPIETGEGSRHVAGAADREAEVVGGHRRQQRESAAVGEALGFRQIVHRSADVPPISTECAAIQEQACSRGVVALVTQPGQDLLEHRQGFRQAAGALQQHSPKRLDARCVSRRRCGPRTLHLALGTVGVADREQGHREAGPSCSEFGVVSVPGSEA
jgi:hypothetical protein